MAWYRMQEMPDMGKTGKQKLYPRIEITGQTTVDRLAELISKESTYSPGEVKGMIESLAAHLALEMKMGRSVKIDGIGTFSPSLGLRDDVEPEEVGGESRRNARSVVVRGVNFRADKQLVLETGRSIHLERSQRSAIHSLHKYTPARRLELAREFLRQHPFLTVADYCSITGLLTTAARMELRRWADTPDSGIGIAGRSSHRVYVAKPLSDNAHETEY